MLFFGLGCGLSSAFAAQQDPFAKKGATGNNNSDPVHWTADKTRCQKKQSFCELTGNAALHQLGESLYGDYISLDLASRVVNARGQVIFVGESAIIQAEEMTYNLDTRTGSITRGKVTNSFFTLTGERINKLGPGRFQTHRGEYSTCQDCPKAWTLLAEDVDLEIEGYAFMERVITKINDAPAMWLPYLVIPIKSKRQTGFLIPRLAFVPSLGISFTQPFFWATSRSTDMTFSIGQAAGRGWQEWEGRYRLGRGEAQVNYFHFKDKIFRQDLAAGGWDKNKRYSDERWSLFVRQQHQLPFGVSERFRLYDVSDSFYPTIFTQDMLLGDPTNSLYGAAFMPTELFFSKSNSDFSSSLIFRRYRNLLTQSSKDFPVQDPRLFDPGTVQALPQFFFGTYPKPIFDTGVYASMDLTAANFSRPAGFYDADLAEPEVPRSPGFNPGRDPIREGTRISVAPQVARSFRLLDAIEGTSSATFRQYFYKFGNPEVPSLDRSYLQLQLDLMSQFERTFETSDAKHPRYKHLVRPILNYSLIPYRRTPVHPFTNQIAYADQRAFTGYQFDNQDIIPLDANSTNANYFAPLGNAVSYGINTAIIRKSVNGPTSNFVEYQRRLDWNIGQSFNFRELKKTDQQSQQPLSRIFSNLNYGFEKVYGYVDNYYYPYIVPIPGAKSRHVVSTNIRYDFSGRGAAGRLLDYQRTVGVTFSHDRSKQQQQIESLSGNLAFSVDDYILPTVSANYDLLNARWLSIDSSLTYRSPSQCWMIGVTHHLQPYCPPPDTQNCSQFTFQWGINLDGSSYGTTPQSKQ